MGIFDSVLDSFGLGGSSDAGANAAAQQQGFNQQGIDYNKLLLDQTTGRLNPFIQAGTDALGNLVAGSTVGGLNEQLAQIFDSDVFSSLFDERTRAAEGALSAGGLTRSGTALQEAGRIPTDIGLMLSNLLSGRNQNLASSGQTAITDLGQLGSSFGQTVGGLYQSSGQAASSGALADAQADSQSASNLVNTAISLGTFFFSDDRLKTNIQVIGQVGPLDLVTWDWREFTEDTIIQDSPTTGVLASQVERHFPEHVHEFGGWNMVDYAGLLDGLEGAH
jgi:hypothetical protein